MKELKTRKGGTILVDDEDYELVSKYKWWEARFKNGRYAACKINGKRTLMHRLILGAEPHQIIDHKDRNGLNNMKENLRFCNRAQNRANAKPWGKSKYLGVTERRGKWYAIIYKDRRARVLGIFPKTSDGEIMAAMAYDAAAIIQYGEFANINIK